jgi:hypothetical protein
MQVHLHKKQQLLASRSKFELRYRIDKIIIYKKGTQQFHSFCHKNTGSNTWHKTYDYKTQLPHFVEGTMKNIVYICDYLIG